MEEQSEKKQNIVYNYLKAKIISNELLPETFVNENDLVDALSISRTPVREAIQRLVNDKLLVSVKGKGTYVSRVIIEDVVAIYDIRSYIDTLAVKLCTGNLTESVANALQVNVKSQYEAIARMDLSQRFHLSHQFEEIYFSNSGNIWLQDYASLLRMHVERIANRLYGKTDEKSLETAVISTDYTNKIAQNIIKGDAEMAGKYSHEFWQKLKWLYFNNLRDRICW